MPGKKAEKVRTTAVPKKNTPEYYESKTGMRFTEKGWRAN